MAEKQNLKKRRVLVGGYHPAVICVWAAIQACANMFPAIALVGVGGTMSLASVIIPLSGVLFGPYTGALCASIGRIIGLLISPSSAWLGPFTFLVATCTAFVAGLLSRGKWPIAYALNFLGIAIFYCFPVGRVAWIKGVTFGVSGILTCLLGGIFAKHFITHKNVILRWISLFTCCAGGLLTSCMFADIANLILFHTPAISMKVLAFISPTERFVFGAAAATVAVPLLLGLNKIGIRLGPQAPEEEADPEPGEGEEMPVEQDAAVQ